MRRLVAQSMVEKEQMKNINKAADQWRRSSIPISLFSSIPMNMRKSAVIALAKAKKQLLEGKAVSYGCKRASVCLYPFIVFFERAGILWHYKYIVLREDFYRNNMIENINEEYVGIF